MWIFGLLFAVIGYFGYIQFQNITATEQFNNSSEVAAIAGNMLVYRGAVLDYAKANTGFTGTIGDSNLTTLPSWYVHMAGVNNYINAGVAYIYYTNPNQALAYRLVKQTQSYNAGIQRSGFLYNPLGGVSVIPVPTPQIPEGAVVYIAK